MKYWKLLSAVCVVVLLHACAKDKTANLAMPITCDSVNISYKNCIQPVFNSYCYQCHSDSASQNGTIAFDLETFAPLKTYLNLYYQNDSIYGSKFLHVIEQTSGVIYMPPTGKLPQQNITEINWWLKAGAPYN